MKHTIPFLLLLTLALSGQAQKNTPQRQQMNRWVDSVMNTFSLEDKVAQLMIVRVPSETAKQKDINAFEHILKHYRVGGICFFKGTTSTQLQRTLRYQRMAHFPLFVSIDGEWGLGMRLTDAYSFPRQMMAGALSPRNDSLIYLMGKEIGRQCQMMGIHINYAPAVDLNSNPDNPVIGSRSFGEDKVRVADKGVLYTKGMQSQGVMAVAKHFPGHGDTDADSHVDLPVVNHTRAYIDSTDLYPFRRMMKAGVRGTMVAHLQVPALDNTPNTPATTSERIANQLLQKEMGFRGLLFTDGMEMGGVTKVFTQGEAELRALMAGCDVILLPNDFGEALKAITARAKADTAVARMVEEKCRKVLREKYKSGLNHLDVSQYRMPSKEELFACSQLTEQMAGKALTLVRNEGNVLPIHAEERVEHFTLGLRDQAVTSITDAVAQRLSKADKVVLHLYAGVNPGKKRNYSCTDQTQDLVSQIVAFNPNTVLVIYGSPYLLRFFAPRTAAQSTLPAAIVMAYQDCPELKRERVEAALCGKERFEGILPVTVGPYKLGTSLTLGKKVKPDPYKAVREMGMNEECFRQIDSLALMGIEKKAYPGCQLFVAYRGKVVYHRGYGRQTYSANSPAVDTNTLYDLASLTKVCATTLSVMRLVDLGKVRLDDPMSRYLPYLKHTNKKNITLKECLSHCARLKAFDSYWKQTDPLCARLSIDATAADCEECRRQVINQIVSSPLNKKEGYLYSDLGFILLADLVRVVSGQTIDLFVAQQFYQPMGLASTTFLPRHHGLDTNRIAPTEDETYWRHRLLRGEVQDQNASAMGGVAGHAGLFSSAGEVGALCQMLLNGGQFRGKQYLSREVVNTFNTRYYADRGNRRALGFDKPFIKDKSTHCAPEASQLSFGHTGYTGTMLWVDPQKELVYVFLSNRVHPSCESNLLSKLNIRTDIQSLIYKSLVENSR